MMNTFKRFIWALCLLPLLTACSWVKDDLSECPTGTWLALDYSYNMLGVDAASKQIKEATIFVYDDSLNYLTTLDVTPTLVGNAMMVQLPELPEGDYNFLVWSGLADTHYLYNPPTTMDNFLLSLANPNQIQNEDMQNLFYGQLLNVHIDNNYNVHRVDLVKDTNRLACIVQTNDPNVVITTDEFTMQVVAPNGVMGSDNMTRGLQNIVYEPFHEENIEINDIESEKPIHAAKYGLNTLRLIEGDNTRLKLLARSTGEVIFDVPLTEYLGQAASFYPELGHELTVQEYLDRQDFHTIVFYLTPQKDALMNCKVNRWIIRENNHIRF